MDNLRVFHEVARVLTSNLELKPLLRAILSKMEEFFGPEGWSLLMVDETTDELYYALSASESEPVGGKKRIRMGEGIAGYVAKSGNPLVIPDVYADRDWAKFAQAHPEHWACCSCTTANSICCRTLPSPSCASFATMPRSLCKTPGTSI